MQTITFHVQGMSCGACVGHVTRALQGVPGVQNAVVDLASASAQVSGESLDSAAIVAAIEEEGYQAQPQLTPTASKTTLPVVQNDSACGCCGS